LEVWGGRRRRGFEGGGKRREKSPRSREESVFEEMIPFPAGTEEGGEEVGAGAEKRVDLFLMERECLHAGAKGQSLPTRLATAKRQRKSWSRGKGSF